MNIILIIKNFVKFIPILQSSYCDILLHLFAFLLEICKVTQIVFSLDGKMEHWLIHNSGVFMPHVNII